jgi:beta-N-acetylhexosaminidase
MTLPLIFGCSGPVLLADEKSFFKEVSPVGFILFSRNIESPDQLKSLVSDLKDLGGSSIVPILIDQEGGRVARLRPPHWQSYPPAQTFGDLFISNPIKALESTFNNYLSLSTELTELGINVNCAPCMDLYFDFAHDIIGNRSFGGDPDQVVNLAFSVIEAQSQSGVISVIKHLPGHGRALSDSHLELPHVDTLPLDLQESDFKVFEKLCQKLKPLEDLKNRVWGMTAHIVYNGIDEKKPATQSKPIVQDVIRGHIGFEGILMSDDLSMKALEGSFEERAKESLEAGCDIVLHCNGLREEMEAVARGCPEASPSLLNRITQSFGGN